jgi:hypothetical protein
MKVHEIRPNIRDMKWSTRSHRWQHTGVRAWTEEVQKRHASELSTIYYARTTGSAMILQFPPPRTLQSSTSPPPSYPHASANPNPIQLHKLAKRKQNPHAYSNLTGERHLYPTPADSGRRALSRAVALIRLVAGSASWDLGCIRTGGWRTSTATPKDPSLWS